MLESLLKCMYVYAQYAQGPFNPEEHQFPPELRICHAAHVSISCNCLDISITIRALKSSTSHQLYSQQESACFIIVLSIKDVRLLVEVHSTVCMIVPSG